MIKRVFFVIASCCLLLACSRNPEAANETLGNDGAANEYPDLEFVLPTGEMVRTQSLTGRNIFIFFNPDCGHCNDEAQAIRENLPRFDNYNLWFISSQAMEAITAFARNHELHDKDNIRFGWSSTDGVLNFYGPIRTPSTYVYVDGRLVKSFSGATPIDSLIGVL